LRGSMVYSSHSVAWRRFFYLFCHGAALARRFSLAASGPPSADMAASLL
jgi:hypothetical protein